MSGEEDKDMNMALALAPQKLRGVLKYNEPMSKHTSWRVGGPAERFYIPADIADLAQFLQGLAADEPVHFIGLGSNLLVRDGGVRGTVVLLHSALNQITLSHGKPGAPSGVYAEAGVASPKVARFAALNGFEGAEFLAGIPGTVGGALAMNAGCYGAETWQHVTEVLTIDCFGELRRRTPQDFDIGYRHVALKAGIGSEWFVAAWFAFKPGNGEVSRKKIKGLLEKRVASQPIGTPNAGSVFRNPAGDYAARLIEACGLKGSALGGAMVSPKHANFIVNAGGATAADIEALIDKVRQTVKAQHGIELVTEVRVIGEALGVRGEEQKHAS
ncbi:UDP-N-acetylenolpyruvoylglucosamine reductase [Sulfuricella denitrificans skB26]|uniref:UDP-N-acetylenolpyruvoylglucosamine reductase n=2 Tax=Sulfuricella denitrificans TaxID=649841 RepID=S6AAW0_SULDS|nr:UDP-N-acetylenolpyruvoylglucosamine reductase [Sulfuricella denitrificans skB26]